MSQPKWLNSPCARERTSISLSRVSSQFTRSSVLLATLALISGALVAGCGSDTVTTEDRPARAIEVSVRIGPKGVQVSPESFGAGLVNFTIANLSDYPAALSIEGPAPIPGNEIQPGGSDNLQGDLVQGSYTAVAMTGTGLEEYVFTVGPPRGNSNQELLLP